MFFFLPPKKDKTMYDIMSQTFEMGKLSIIFKECLKTSIYFPEVFADILY